MAENKYNFYLFYNFYFFKFKIFSKFRQLIFFKFFFINYNIIYNTGYSHIYNIFQPNLIFLKKKFIFLKKIINFKNVFNIVIF